MKKFVFASDLHGDHQDTESVDVLLQFIKDFKPDKKVFGGDLFDFRPLRKGAGSAERAESMEADVYAGLEFLGKFKPDVLLLGNHDARLWKTAEYDKVGLVMDLAKQGVRDIVNKCKSINCKIIPYDASSGFHDIGKVRFIHGYFAGIYATKRHADTYSPNGGIVLHGHTHSIGQSGTQRVGGAAGMAVGCLATTDMQYNKHWPNRLTHRNGFAYGYSDTKQWEVFQAKKGPKGWALASEIKLYGVQP